MASGEEWAQRIGVGKPEDVHLKAHKAAEGERRSATIREPTYSNFGVPTAFLITLPKE